MPRIFLGNFDFEHDLAGAPTSRDDRQLAEINRRLSRCWEPLLAPQDLVAWLEPGGVITLIDPSTDEAVSSVKLAPDTNLCPWGWSPSAFDVSEKLNCVIDAPDVEIVRRVNRRSFRFQLEQELGVLPVGSALIRDLADLHQALEDFSSSDKWVIKAEFGMSGRERILGRGTELSEAARNWIARQLRTGSALVFEPWLNSIREAGILFEIPRETSPQFLGVAQLLTDASGTYRGSRFGDSSDSTGWEPAVETGFEVARILQGIGYFGPLGIDAMEYETQAGGRQLRVLQDLNARLTMGRLALAWKEHLAPHECASWVSAKKIIDTERLFSSSNWPAGVRIVSRSYLSGTPGNWHCIAAISPAARLHGEKVLESA